MSNQIFLIIFYLCLLRFRSIWMTFLSIWKRALCKGWRILDIGPGLIGAADSIVSLFVLVILGKQEVLQHRHGYMAEVEWTPRKMKDFLHMRLQQKFTYGIGTYIATKCNIFWHWYSYDLDILTYICWISLDLYNAVHWQIDGTVSMWMEVNCGPLRKAASDVRIQ